MNATGTCLLLAVVLIRFIVVTFRHFGSTDTVYTQWCTPFFGGLGSWQRLEFTLHSRLGRRLRKLDRLLQSSGSVLASIVKSLLTLLADLRKTGTESPHVPDETSAQAPSSFVAIYADITIVDGKTCNYVKNEEPLLMTFSSWIISQVTNRSITKISIVFAMVKCDNLHLARNKKKPRNIMAPFFLKGWIANTVEQDRSNHNQEYDKTHHGFEFIHVLLRGIPNSEPLLRPPRCEHMTSWPHESFYQFSWVNLTEMKSSWNCDIWYNRYA